MSTATSKRRSFANRGLRLFEKIKGEMFSKSPKEEVNTVFNHPQTSNIRIKRDLSMRRLDSTEGLHEAKISKVEYGKARKPGIIPKMWTEEQDAALRLAVGKYGERKWKEIAAEVPGRTALQCHQRWKKALRPGLKKGTWSGEEDAKLTDLVKQSNDWIYISTQIEGRNPKQCRERWRLNLDPSIKKTPWTEEEDNLLRELHARQGGRWSQIAKSIPGRTENNVKTRFHSLQRLEAKLRGWTPQEDQVLMNECMRIGRNFQQISKLLPGRTKGMLKKRFTILVQNDPNLLLQVEKLELANRQNEGQSPTTKLKSQTKKPQMVPSAQPGSVDLHTQPIAPEVVKQEKREKQMTNRSNSSWLEEVVESITVPNIPHSMARTNSTTVLLDVIENTPVGYQEDNKQLDSFSFHPSENGSHMDGISQIKQLGDKTNSLSLLEKFIGGDFDTWDMEIPVDTADFTNNATINKSKRLAPKGSYLSSGMDLDFARISHDSRLSQGGSGRLLLEEMDWVTNNIQSEKQSGFADMRSLSDVLNM